MMKIFISYSHADRAWCDDLARQLLGIDRNIVSDVWYDKSIQPGDNWDAEIQKRMAMSDVIVLLISSNFVGAKFCPFEAERALELKESNSCTIVPVLLRKCLYESLGLGRMDTSPHGRPPVDGPGWDGPDDALTQVANEVRAAAAFRLGVPVRRHGFEPDRSAQLKKMQDLLHLFCDRSPQGRVLNRAMISARPFRNRPLLVVMDGYQTDRPDKYIDRLKDNVFKEYFSQKPIEKLTSLDWPSEVYTEDPFELFGEGVRRSLSVPYHVPVEKANKGLCALNGVNMLPSLIMAKTWNANTEAVFRKYLQLWRDWPRLPKDRFLVPLIRIERLEGEPLNPRIQEFLQSSDLRSNANLNVVVLPPFEKVEMSDFFTWLEHDEVKNRFEDLDGARIRAGQINFPLRIYDLEKKELPRFIGGF